MRISTFVYVISQTAEGLTLLTHPSLPRDSTCDLLLLWAYQPDIHFSHSSSYSDYSLYALANMCIGIKSGV